MIRLVFVLTMICAISSALLAMVYNQTKEPIAAALEQRTRLAAAQVMPVGLSEPEKIVVGEDAFYVCRVDGEIVAVAVEGSSKNGYSGLVTLMVGMNTVENTLVGYEVVVSTETPGLGTKITSDAFRKPLLGKPLNSPWKVRKEGGDVDAVTAATISSVAALECIKDAISKMERAGLQ